MSRRPVFVAFVLLVVALAGCTQTGPDAPDGDGVRTGEYVQVHYIARAKADGAVLASTVDGAVGDRSLEEIPASEHEARWFYTHDPGFQPTEPAEDVLVEARFVDLQLDPDEPTLFHAQYDLFRNQTGDLVRTDRNISLHRIPDNVTDPAIVPTTGFFDAVQGAEEGQVVVEEVPPQDAYGVRDPRKVVTQDRVQGRFNRNVSYPVSTLEDQSEDGESNWSESTEVGDRIHLALRGLRYDAVVQDINESASQVHVRLLVEEGMPFSVEQPWNATIVNVTSEKFRVRHDPGEGQVYEFRGQTFTVEDVRPWKLVFDYNDPKAGTSVVYEIRIVQRLRPDADRHLIGREVGSPVDDIRDVHDVAFPNADQMLITADDGVYVTFTTFWGTWFPRFPALDGANVTVLEPSPTGDGPLLAATEGRGLLRSADGGASYEEVGTGLPAGAIAEVTVSAADPDVVYALVEGDGIYRSTDAGASFNRSSTNLTTANSLDAARGDVDRLYAATDDGLVVSDDAGRTWTEVAFADRQVKDVEIPDDGRMVASVDGAVHESTDDGSTWTQLAEVDLLRMSYVPDRPKWLFGVHSDGLGRISQDGGEVWRAVTI